MNTDTKNDYQAMVEEGRLFCFGVYVFIGVVLGLLWFFSPIFGMIAGVWGMIGALVFWFTEDSVRP